MRQKQLWKITLKENRFCLKFLRIRIISVSYTHLINIHTIKPLDKDLICRAAEDSGILMTVEEHSVIGGLGSAVAEAVTECYPVPVIKIGVNDEYGHSGPAADLLKEFGLCKDNIISQVKKALK